mgnify:CR=1 FL=1
MKKTILTTVLLAMSTFLFAQNAPVDFEAGGNGADWTWEVFENVGNPALEIIDNPDKTGGNTSDKVAKFTALGDNATGKAVYMTMADGGNTTFGGTVTATSFTSTSDSRLKSKVQPLNLGLQFINKLSPVSYFKMSRSQYNGEEDNNDLSYEYGLIAQELEEVLKETDPENTVVTKGDDGLLGVSYMQLVMPLIKSVQELSSYVEELESNSLWIKCRKTIVRTIATFLEGHRGQLSVIVLGSFSDSNMSSNLTADRVFFEQNCKLIDQFPFFLSSEEILLPRHTRSKE